MVENPFFFRIGQNFSEKLDCLVSLQKYILVWSFVVWESRGYHHSFDAKSHCLVEEFADFVRIGVVENCGVCGDPESALYGFFYAFYGDVVRAGFVYGFVVHFTSAVKVYAQRQIFARFV